MELFSHNHFNWSGIYSFNSIKLLKHKKPHKKMNILESLKTKTATTIFAVIGIIGGFFFLNRNLTGNVIIGNETTTSLVSLIGLLLIACSVVLGVYTIRKK